MSSLNIGLVNKIEVKSIGKPGERTFNISVSNENGSLLIWMEKEQLLQLGMSLNRFISTNESNSDPTSFTSKQTVLEFVNIEFKTTEMSLTYDSYSDMFTLTAHVPYQSADLDTDIQAVIFNFSRIQAQDLSKTALKVVASGRSPCPLCGGPLDPTGEHFCVKKNGHNIGNVTK